MKARTVSLIAFYGLVSVLSSVVGAAWLAWRGHPLYGCAVLACMVGVGHWLINRDYAKKG
jgi:hypothetical protein